MKVELEGVTQHVNLRTNVVENYLVLVLPTGQRINTQVEEKVLESVLSSVGSEPAPGEREAFVGSPASYQPPTPPTEVEWSAEDEEAAPDVPPGSFESFVGAEQDQPEPVDEDENEERIVWNDLEEGILPESMKVVMRELQIAPELPMSALVKVTDQIAERMMAQATLAQPPQQQEAPRTRVMNAVPPRRTVPTTDMGYPKVAGVDNDPGEFARDADEDGVAQL